MLFSIADINSSLVQPLVPTISSAPSLASTTYHASVLPKEFSFTLAYSSSGWTCTERFSLEFISLTSSGNFLDSYFLPKISSPLLSINLSKLVPLNLPLATMLVPF